MKLQREPCRGRLVHQRSKAIHSKEEEKPKACLLLFGQSKEAAHYQENVNVKYSSCYYCLGNEMKRSASSSGGCSPQHGDETTLLSSKPNKKRRPHFRGPKPPPPAFTDVTASVAAATFAARRLPELKELHATFSCGGGAAAAAAAAATRKDPSLSSLPKTASLSGSLLLDVTGLQSAGGKISSRHLRRRVTSFRRRQQHRYPRRPNNNNIDNNTARPAKSAENNDSLQVVRSRRSRRKNKKTLWQEHSSWTVMRDVHSDMQQRRQKQEHDSDTAADDNDAVVHWIPTHIWHAKRFRMHELWNWQVPLLHTNRGTKAALRLVAKNEKCLVQDVTWRTQPIWCQVSSSAMNNNDIADLCRSLVRILPTFPNNIVSESPHKGGKMVVELYGESILHKADQFPMEPIGPAKFLVVSDPIIIQEDGGQGREDGVFVYIWVHPSIRDALHEQVKQVCSGITLLGGPYSGIDGGLGCLQVRGKNAIDCMAKSLNDHDNDDNEFLAAKVRIENIQTAASDKSTRSFLQRFDKGLLCVLARPRDPTLACNYGVTGIDIFGTPGRLQRLFLQLILRGGACPIGLVEETALCLESQPPMAVFPRDFPDTEQGLSYWLPGSCHDWSTLREYDNGSTGRIRNSNLCDTAIEWADCMSAQSQKMIVVRGSLLKPFVDALESLENEAVSYTKIGKETVSYKRRRKATNLTYLRRVPRPSTDKIYKRKSYCDDMAHSLTLPAALLCDVTVDGPGTLELGAPLFSYTKSIEHPLGFVTSGSFSPFRGSFHGTAVVEAKSFLLAVGQAHDSEAAASSRRRFSSANSRLTLLVQVGGDGNTRAGLSIIFA